MISILGLDSFLFLSFVLHCIVPYNLSTTQKVYELNLTKRRRSKLQLQLQHRANVECDLYPRVSLMICYRKVILKRERKSIGEEDYTTSIDER